MKQKKKYEPDPALKTFLELNRVLFVNCDPYSEISWVKHNLSRVSDLAFNEIVSNAIKYVYR